MVIEGVSHFHCVHVAEFSLPGYDSVANFKEAPTATDDIRVTLAVTIPILQHFCRVFKTAVLLWTPWLDRPVLCCRPPLPGLKQSPPSQGYHVAMLGMPGALRFVSLRPRLPTGCQPLLGASASAAATKIIPRHRTPIAKLPGAALPPGCQSTPGIDPHAVPQHAAFVVDAISLMNYSTVLFSQTKGFLKRPHPFYLKLKTLAELGVVRSGLREHFGYIG